MRFARHFSFLRARIYVEAPETIYCIGLHQASATVAQKKMNMNISRIVADVLGRLSVDRDNAFAWEILPSFARKSETPSK